MRDIPELIVILSKYIEKQATLYNATQSKELYDDLLLLGAIQNVLLRVEVLSDSFALEGKILSDIKNDNVESRHNLK